MDLERIYSISRPVSALIIGGLMLLSFGCSRIEESPQNVFAAFESVLEKGELNQLDSFASRNSVQYFQGLQPWIVRGDEKSLKKLTPFDRYLILVLRMHLDSWSLTDWQDWNEALDSGKQNHAVSGYLREALDELFFKTALGKVDFINGITAGQLLRLGSPTGLSLRFINEEGWKIELSRLFCDSFEQKLKPYLSDQYRNRDRVWEMLKKEYGDRIDRSLYHSRIANASGN
ncbi:hypothetical protein [Candidatus Pelagisphaera phototrophica]|uniref:hypothetical protein n=1 Tax=Candidatus Pelagisphaera phototrophica TaxID=2684113 RepID=UPI001A05B2EE|nr:hypothetical protein [Candidatus Pelagisphaera phototrophica]QXD30507.1 hypothetical protein GA004_08920 [Candidatus Pelagisphaera phototrophica]